MRKQTQTLSSLNFLYLRFSFNSQSFNCNVLTKIQTLTAFTVFFFCLFVCLFPAFSAVPAPAVSAAASGCAPPPVRRKVDPRRLQVLQQPEVDALALPSLCNCSSLWCDLCEKHNTVCHVVLHRLLASNTIEVSLLQFDALDWEDLS